MLRIWINDTELPNGPFPITGAQLAALQERWQDELRTYPGPLGARLAPQTTVRPWLKELGLDDFDALAVGFAVTSCNVRSEESE